MKIAKVEVIPFGVPIKKFAEADAEFHCNSSKVASARKEDGEVRFSV